jgi:Putative zinc-finger
MTCSDVQRVLPDFLDGEPGARLQPDFQAHLKSCPDCSDLVSDLNLISIEARQLAAADEPAPRVWVRIAAELRAEGIIKEPDALPTRPVLVPTPPRRPWSAWWLAPITAAILAAGAYVVSNDLNHKPAPQVAVQPKPTPPVTTPAPETTPQQTVAAASTEESSLPVSKSPDRNVVPTVARVEDEPAESRLPHTAAPPSAEDRQFLSFVSTQAPSIRATYENQLEAVNADIRETQAYVNQYPGDAEARQHLMDAYEQKALLYQIALDRIQ